MFHPDHCYEVRMLRHQDLQTEAARMRLAAQASEATFHRPGRAGATMKALAVYLGSWLQLAPIGRSRTSKGSS
jgi:hypothetical protein